MRFYVKALFVAGLLFSVMAPGFASAKNDRGSCRLQSDEFVYVTQSIESKIAFLQADLQKNNVKNNALIGAMNQLIKANEAVYQDAGKYAQTHDQFGYSTAKLEALRNSAANYYTQAYKHYQKHQDHLDVAFALQEMSILAVDEFAGQCAQTRVRTKKWKKKWNDIDNGSSAEAVTKKFQLDKNVKNNAKAIEQIEEQAPVTVVENREPPKPREYPAEWHMTPEQEMAAAQQAMGNGMALENMMMHYMAAQAQQTDAFMAAMGGRAPQGGHYARGPHGVQGQYVPVMPPAAPVVVPMTDAEFQTLYNTVKKASFDEGKSAVIIEAVKGGNVLTVSQAAQLLKLVGPNRDYKVDAAFEIYKTVYDPKNWYQVYDAFSFDSEKSKLRKKLSGMPPAAPVVFELMNDSDFQRLYNTVKKASFDEDMNAVIVEAVKGGNVLTVSQAVQLLKLMGSNRDFKVDAAFEIYKTVYDPKNWYQVYDAFSFDSEKSKLRKKVEGYQR